MSLAIDATCTKAGSFWAAQPGGGPGRAREGRAGAPLRRAFRTAAALVLAALLLAGCERQVPALDYFPMRDGNRWEYRLLDHEMLKRIEAGGTVSAELTDGTVTEEELIEHLPPKAETVPPDGAEAPPEAKPAAPPADPGRKARRVVLELLEAVTPVTYRAKYDRYEQVWSKQGGYVGFQNARGRHYLLILPPHSTYKWVVTAPSGDNLFYEIEAHQDVETPAGIFRACAIAREETRDKRVVYRYWFAPHTGLVRRSRYYLGEEVFRQELIDSKIRPSTAEGRMAEEREIHEALKGTRRGREYQKKKPGIETEPPPLPEGE
ncbi:MAG: hypothetical protein M5U26_28205 [Planctomycetota bacterium]|nr:hypothetical protein [Planctomycetota bacterium]